MFLYLRGVCSPAIMLPTSTYREQLASEDRSLSDPENDFSQASSGNQIRNSDAKLPPENSSEATLGSSSPNLFFERTTEFRPPYQWLRRSDFRNI